MHIYAIPFMPPEVALTLKPFRIHYHTYLKCP